MLVFFYLYITPWSEFLRNPSSAADQPRTGWLRGAEGSFPDGERAAAERAASQRLPATDRNPSDRLGLRRHADHQCCSVQIIGCFHDKMEERVKD